MIKRESAGKSSQICQNEIYLLYYTSKSVHMTDHARLRQHSERGDYGRETLNRILDESLICHVALVQGAQVFNIPMLFARDGDSILLHASVKSRMYETLSSGSEICIAVTLLDGIVVAKSAFHSSMNYRSAMIFGSAEAVDQKKAIEEMMRILKDKGFALIEVRNNTKSGVDRKYQIEGVEGVPSFKHTTKSLQGLMVNLNIQNYRVFTDKFGGRKRLFLQFWKGS